MLVSKCHSDGPSAGPAEASGLPEAHGPRGHCTPPALPPPSRWPCRNLLKGMSLSDLFVKAHCYLILFWSPAIKPLRFKTFF